MEIPASRGNPTVRVFVTLNDAIASFGTATDSGAADMAGAGARSVQVDGRPGGRPLWDRLRVAGRYIRGRGRPTRRLTATGRHQPLRRLRGRRAAGETP